MEQRQRGRRGLALTDVGNWYGSLALRGAKWVRGALAYEWDIFLSYARPAPMGQWVHNHFLPTLRDCLMGELPEEPRIFVDTEQPTGVQWPLNLQHALLHSRILVAVWSPPYFRSDWCRAEWESMLAREEYLSKQGRPVAQGLVYPVVFSDGKHFDERARATQCRHDFSRLNNPRESFADTARYDEFHTKVSEIAAELEYHLQLSPPWEAEWPVSTPSATTSTVMKLPAL